MPDDIAISVENVSKAYRIWNDPAARLKSPLCDGLAGFLPSPGKAKLKAKAQSYYRDFYALKDISFKVRKGESVGIIGRNGSGKSTLLQIIAGTLRPTTGSVRVNGRVAALLELGSGFNPEFTGRENVYLNSAVLGFTRRQTDAKFYSIAAFADIGDFLEQPVKTYSSGMLMRLAFAVQTAVEPEILIVDEALAVGDEAFQRKCFARIEALRNGGTTVLLVTHATNTVLEICDRTLFMHAALLRLDGIPKSVVRQYHRLLYAPPENIGAILAEFSSGTVEQACTIVPPPSSGSGSAENAAAETEDLSFFDPKLVSHSKLSYVSLGAAIVNPRIQTITGTAVNHLTKDLTYEFAYEVHFTHTCQQVRMAHVFKTLTGVELAGTTLRGLGHVIPVAAAGQVARVRIRFTCLLNPGTYLANAGVLGVDGHDESYLHRIVDALIFRVLPEAGANNSCYVDLKFRPSVTMTSLSSSSRELFP